jgi:predicted ArsR family transcriptional regulator
MGRNGIRSKNPILSMKISTQPSLERVLADERRSQLVGELRSASGGLDAHELARRVGLHPNTVRWHLGVLQDAGAVSSEPAPRASRGRPRIVYRLRAEAAGGTRGEYRLLATILTGTLAQSDDGGAAAERNGRAWGRYLVKRPLPLVETGDDEATKEVAALLDEQGFAPETAEGEIRMRRCPFLDLAEAQPEIVCAVHKGLISGALEELGSQLEVKGLDVLVEPNLCVVRLGRTKGR